MSETGDLHAHSLTQSRHMSECRVEETLHIHTRIAEGSPCASMILYAHHHTNTVFDISGCPRQNSVGWPQCPLTGDKGVGTSPPMAGMLGPGREGFTFDVKSASCCFCCILRRYYLQPPQCRSGGRGQQHLRRPNRLPQFRSVVATSQHIGHEACRPGNFINVQHVRGNVCAPMVSRRIGSIACPTHDSRPVHSRETWPVCLQGWGATAEPWHGFGTPLSLLAHKLPPQSAPCARPHQTRGLGCFDDPAAHAKRTEHMSIIQVLVMATGAVARLVAEARIC